MPLLSPPPPARRGGSSRRPRRRRRYTTRRERDWADLPLDALLHVFHKLDLVDLMFGGASRACRTWHSAAREPELWRCIDLRGYSQIFRETISLNRMARLAIWFSAGQCTEFTGDDIDDDLVRFLAEQELLLKSIRFTEFNVNIKIFAKAIEKWPLLEELELSTCYRDVTKIIELVATSCPQLKHFKRVKGIRRGYAVENSEALAIARLHELRSLQLFHLNLDNEALTVILNNCPHLDFLDLRDCCNVVIDSSLQSKCARIKTKYFKPFSPTTYFRYLMYPSDNDEHDCEFLYAEGSDSEDSDHSCCYSRAEEIDFEEHEKSFFKGTRRRPRT